MPVPLTTHEVILSVSKIIAQLPSLQKGPVRLDSPVPGTGALSPAAFAAIRLPPRCSSHTKSKWRKSLGYRAAHNARLKPALRPNRSLPEWLRLVYGVAGARAPQTGKTARRRPEHTEYASRQE